MRAAFWGWAALIVAANLAIFVSLPAWENPGDSFVPNWAIFVGSALLINFVWFFGLVVLRQLVGSHEEWRQVRKIQAKLKASHEDRSQ